ncbi:hypothetical protein AB6A40_008025 [Gnathostoma spinigerum]|uniref:MRG domain-containing protein n=1 Tax=Gnathostoma spinigerum TaxID=75299 RepID=A0ABD6EPV7_9BILA
MSLSVPKFDVFSLSFRLSGIFTPIVYFVMPKRSQSSGEKKACSTASSADETPLYSIDSKVLCRHIDNLYYESKIIAVERKDDGEIMYTVHYQGWNHRHDEKISQTHSKDRFLELTPENLERAKIEMEEAKKRQLESKKVRKVSVIDEKSSRSTSSASESDATTLSSDVSTRRKSNIPKPGSPENPSRCLLKTVFRVELSPILKEILVDDRLMIQEKNLVRLPARVPVAEIHRQYADYIGRPISSLSIMHFEFSGDGTLLNGSRANFMENSIGIQALFDVFLSRQLLYKFEWPQFLKIQKEQREKRDSDEDHKLQSSGVPKLDELIESLGFQPSRVYGLIHLLRLFVKLESIIKVVRWPANSNRAILYQIQDFVKFLEVNRFKFYDKSLEYEPSTKEYQEEADAVED